MKIKQIIDTAFESAVAAAVRETIADEWGRGIDSEIKDAIRDHAKELLSSDAEIKGLIRDRITHWIAKQ